MTFHDVFGCDVTTADPASVAPWNQTMLGFLAHSAQTPARLAAVLALDPEFVMALACRGLFTLMLGRRELYPAASAALNEAQASQRQRGANRREQLYVDALAQWLAGHPSRAVASIDTVLESWPQDALAMKIGQAVRFMLGDQAGMRQSLERIMPAYASDHRGLGYLHGCYAFALEEAGEYRRAELHGRSGLEIAPDDAWGLHAVAHIYDMTARPAEGIAFLDANQAAWTHCNNFRYHVWWHLALLHLDEGAPDKVLALYDAEIRRDHTDDYRDIANATSLLMRLELEGICVGDRWAELADLCARRIDDGCLAFADLHYMLALCGDARPEAIQGLLRRMQVDAVQNAAEGDAVMRNPGLLAAKGLRAFAAGQHAQAFGHLRAARATMQRVGGSHAQRDVFERITIEAAIRSGALADATSLIDARGRKRGACDSFGASRAKLVEDLRAKPGMPGTTAARTGAA